MNAHLSAKAAFLCMKWSLLVWFCLVASTIQAQETLRWSVAGEVQTLDPHAYRSEAEKQIIHQMYEGLFAQGESLQPQPELVATWNQLSPTQWEFTLQPDVWFHDETQLQASDVVFSLRRAMQKGSSVRPNAHSFRSIEVLDEQRLQLITTRPNPLLLLELSQIKIVSESWLRSRNRGDLNSEISLNELPDLLEANGTGPFQLNETQRDQLELVASAKWWQPKEHPLSTVQVRFEVAPDRHRELLEDGRVDLLTNVAEAQVPLLKQDERLRVWQRAALRTLFLGMDRRIETQESAISNPLAEKKIRRALRIALSPEDLVEKVLPGMAIPSDHILPPDALGGPSPQPSRPEIKTNALATLMSEAGYADGFSLTLDCPTDYYFRAEELCRKIMERLLQVGIQVTLNLRPAERHFEVLRQDQSRFYLLGWGMPTQDAHHLLNYLYRSSSSWNHTGYAKPLVDALIEAVDRESNPQLRAQMLELTWSILQDDPVYLPLLHPLLSWATRNDWTVPVRPDGIPLLVQARLLTAE